jgi:hypothetical protein
MNTRNFSRVIQYFSHNTLRIHPIKNFRMRNLWNRFVQRNAIEPLTAFLIKNADGTYLFSADLSIVKTTFSIFVGERSQFYI